MKLSKNNNNEIIVQASLQADLKTALKTVCFFTTSKADTFIHFCNLWNVFLLYSSGPYLIIITWWIAPIFKPQLLYIICYFVRCDPSTISFSEIMRNSSKGTYFCVVFVSQYVFFHSSNSNTQAFTFSFWEDSILCWRGNECSNAFNHRFS